MKYLKNHFLFLISGVVLILTSCNVSPKEIEYGKVHCHFCDMTVVDKAHSAQFVTKKGKVYIFDAIECMSREIVRKKIENELTFELVADFSNPGTLIDANKAMFLISEQIKSPMGENLSAFSSKEKAEEFQMKYTGKIYTWQEIKSFVK